MKMIIGGQHLDASDGQVLPVINPATMEQIDTVPAATEADIAKTLDLARQGQQEWSQVPLYARIDTIKRFRALLEQHAGEVSELLTRELGKPLSQSMGETDCTLNIIDNFCECARTLGGQTYAPNNFSHITGHLVLTLRQPLGVIACILPFNYPIELYVQKVVPALLMGNAVIIKPASDTPMANIRMTELLLEAGIPANAAQIVTGSGSRIGRWLTESDKIDGISLTGSTEVGVQTAVSAAKHLHEVGLELGGNDPLLILDDCDLDYAVSEAVEGRYANSGQTCCASKRFLVDNRIRQAFTQKLVRAVEALKVGDPMKPDTSYGPMVSESAAQDVIAQIDATVKEGARVATGGKLFDKTYISPTVLTDVTPSMAIAREMEVFGPVWPIIGFDTLEEAVRIANDTPYGLSSGIITGNVPVAIKLAKRIQAACTVINGCSIFRTPEQAFGGYKMTGIGQEGGTNTLLAMSLTKTLVLKGMLD